MEEFERRGEMRVGYSILREINRKNFSPSARDYGITDREFENFIFFLENKDFVERVLRVNDEFSIKVARLTTKGKMFLDEMNQYEETYPTDRQKLIEWVQIERELYSNGGIEELDNF